MNRHWVRWTACFAAFASLAPLPAKAEYLSPDWNGLQIEGVAPPEWIAGVRDGAFIGMCTGCPETLMLQVRVQRDDGTGGRVHSGETTADTYTEIGKANAAELGAPADYYGTEAIDFASAKGFKTSARGATGDYSATYQLWSDGQQLIVTVYGKDQEAVGRTADAAYEAAASLTFR